MASPDLGLVPDSVTPPPSWIARHSLRASVTVFSVTGPRETRRVLSDPRS